MKKIVEYRTPYGAYRSSVKIFNSEKHFDNWYMYMVNKGYKIEGVYDEGYAEDEFNNRFMY